MLQCFSCFCLELFASRFELEPDEVEADRLLELLQDTHLPGRLARFAQAVCATTGQTYR